MPVLLNRALRGALVPLCLGALLLLSGFSARAQEFLDPAIAFIPRVAVVDDHTLEVRFDIAEGYYLYRDKFRFAVAANALGGLPQAATSGLSTPAATSGVVLGTPVLPAGKRKHDDTFGEVSVLYEQATILLPLERERAEAIDFSLRIVSQGCADAGLCYPPQTRILPVHLPPAGSLPKADRADAVSGDAAGHIAARLEASGWGNLALFFVAGVLLAFTPCVLPMLPILSSIVVGDRRDAPHAKRRAFALSLCYVLGMALTYALAGVAAGLTGALLSAALQNVWVLGGFAAIFVLLSLSMFGFYELQMPSALQSLLTTESNRLDARFSGFARGIGVFAMGALSALIVGPCVAAPLAGALLYIGKSGDALLGGLSLFVMALGMGVPLIVAGVAAGALPKSGPWMARVKRFFGVLLLATSLWLLTPVLPEAALMLGWALLLIIPAIHLCALDPLPPAAGGFLRFGKGIGVVMLLAGMALLAGLLGGSRDPLQPLAVFAGGGQGNSTQGVSFERVTNLAELDARLARLREEGRPALLDFYADWCVSCKEMERFTFRDPAVRAKLEGFVRLQADVTANSEADRALLARFHLFGPPGILFFDPEGKEIEGVRVVGFQTADTFAQVLERVAAGRR